MRIYTSCVEKPHDDPSKVFMFIHRMVLHLQDPTNNA